MNSELLNIAYRPYWNQRANVKQQSGAANQSNRADSGNVKETIGRTGAFNRTLARKDSAKASRFGGNAAASVWGRTAAKTQARLVNYVSANKHCSLAEFTAFYEAGLQAGERIDYAALVKGATGFSDVFSDYKVITKVGNCNVSAANWQRNDFPHCKFFQEGTTADALNDWEPSGPEPRMDSASVQRNLNSIGPGKISIIIPEKLQEKMDADPAYAEQIYAKVAKWKTDYDRWDNATAASLGMNVAEEQFCKSYCLNLDEEGNVKNFVVTGGGGKIVGPTEEEQRQFEAEQAEKRRRRIEYMRIVKESALRRAAMERALYAGQSSWGVQETTAFDAGAYTGYLKAKYGNVTIKSVGKDRESLEGLGGSMNGSDVIIAPNILEQMANDMEKAAYYEGKIDDYFKATPQLTAFFAAKGLVYEPGGVIVHEDGTVTYVGGCSDSPERVARVNAINREKREKQAMQRRAALERSQEIAMERRQMLEDGLRLAGLRNVGEFFWR